MDSFVYWALLRDAVIYNCNKSEEGKDYLDKCYVFEQVNPEKNSLRNRFGGGV